MHQVKSCVTCRGVYCRLPWNRCGCVYQLEVDADFIATQMYSLICGNNVTNTDKDNKCDISSIAAPDNLSMMRGHNQMIIGEDTEDHQNDVVWLYSFDVSFNSMLACSRFSLWFAATLLACNRVFSAINRLSLGATIHALCSPACLYACLHSCLLAILNSLQSVLAGSQH